MRRGWTMGLMVGFAVLSCASAADILAEYVIFGGPVEFTPASLGLTGAFLPAYLDTVVVTSNSTTTMQVEACVAGFFSYDDAQACTACGAGKYSGAYAAGESGTCVLCDAGKYSTSIAATASAVCTDCPAGTYYDGAGGQSLGVCASCPGNASSYAGSKLLQACVCNGGYQGANGGACSPCNASVWCLNGQANPCPTHSRSAPLSSSLAQCLCLPGFYGDTTLGGPELTLCQVHTSIQTRHGNMGLVKIG